MQPKFLQLLQQRIEKGSERSLLSFDTEMIDFWSNDYLGLGRNASEISLKSGSGSRLISGNSRRVEAVEEFLAFHFGSEAALIFNSGYDANLGFFSSVPQKGDTILYDELIHASVRDGMRLSFAKSFSFLHNDLRSLEKRLTSAQGTIFVAVESLYSMDGDIAPLKEIADLCERYNALLIVDEAHAGAVFGEKGTGLCNETGITDKVFARLFTFGKGYGAHGGAILASPQLRQFLVNFARSFIYTTALPEAFYEHIRFQVEDSVSPDFRDKLQENIAFFRSRISSPVSAFNSPIQVIPFKELESCKQKAELLRENGIAVKAILPPTVPENGQRLRICLHAFNTQAEIEKLVDLLK
jgi:8-amino-7-oxononanoate synthase